MESFERIINELEKENVRLKQKLDQVGSVFMCYHCETKRKEIEKLESALSKAFALSKSLENELRKKQGER